MINVTAKQLFYCEVYNQKGVQYVCFQSASIWFHKIPWNVTDRKCDVWLSFDVDF